MFNTLIYDDFEEPVLNKNISVLIFFFFVIIKTRIKLQETLANNI